MSRFEEAKEKYAAYGVDVDKALEKLGKVRISMHCWQGDDVLGFDSDSLQRAIIQAKPPRRNSSWLISKKPTP